MLRTSAGRTWSTARTWSYWKGSSHRQHCSRCFRERQANHLQILGAGEVNQLFDRRRFTMFQCHSNIQTRPVLFDVSCGTGGQDLTFSVWLTTCHADCRVRAPEEGSARGRMVKKS